jgi:hypothetical protein
LIHFTFQFEYIFQYPCCAKGGLDNYLLETPTEKLRSTTGEAAKARILMALEMNDEEKIAFRSAQYEADQLKPSEFGYKKMRKGGRKAADQHRKGIALLMHHQAELKLNAGSAPKEAQA